MVASAETMAALALEQEKQRAGDVPEGQRIPVMFDGTGGVAAPNDPARGAVKQLGATVVLGGGALGLLVYALTEKPLLSVAAGFAGGTALAVFDDHRRKARERARAAVPAPMGAITGGLRSGEECPPGYSMQPTGNGRGDMACMPDFVSGIESTNNAGCPVGFHAVPTGDGSGRTTCVPDVAMAPAERALRDPVGWLLQLAGELGLNTTGMPTVGALGCNNEGGRVVCRDSSGAIQAIDGEPQPNTDLEKLSREFTRRFTARSLALMPSEPTPTPTMIVRANGARS